MKTIGILGGGQLGMMLAQSIVQYGGEVRVFGRADAPASQTVPNYVVGDFGDSEALMAFAAGCDAIVLEMEHIEPTPLREIKAVIFPPLPVLEVVQNRLKEKMFLEHAGLPHAAFRGIHSSSEVAGLNFNFPCISKTVFGGYDGLGQSFQGTQQSLKEFLDQLPEEVSQRGVVLEEIIELEAELSCTVAMNSAGEMTSLPVIENVHRQHILDISVLPARMPNSVTSAVREIAEACASALGAKGLLTVEFFVTRKRPIGPCVEVDGYYVLINEMAPRPHNSGHVTRKALSLSQFDLLARVLLDLPLVDAFLLESRPGHGFVMGNLLSDLWNGSAELDLEELGKFPELLEFFLYGKSPERPRRKMGHFLMYLTDITTAEDSVRAVQNALSKA